MAATTELEKHNNIKTTDLGAAITTTTAATTAAATSQCCADFSRSRHAASVGAVFGKWQVT